MVEEEKLSNELYPLLLIPKNLITLETGCDFSYDVFLDLKITSTDTDNNLLNLYSGLCNVKVLDNESLLKDGKDYSLELQTIVQERSPVRADPYIIHSWMNHSPNQFNNFEVMESQDLSYSLYRENDQIMVAQVTSTSTATYVSPTLSNESACNWPKPFQHKKFRKSISKARDDLLEDESSSSSFQSSPDTSTDSRKTSPNQIEEGDDIALAQLMSSDIQKRQCQRGTILYLGQNSKCGDTVHNITLADESIKCYSNSTFMKERTSGNMVVSKKKYQCNKCKQLFNRMVDFKRHLADSHDSKASEKLNDETKYSSVKYCKPCNKTFKCHGKFVQHLLGHNDPNVKCHKCKKVFATKYSLRNHLKIHNRTHHCTYCQRSYDVFDDLQKHVLKMHSKRNTCFYCPKKFKDDVSLLKHVDKAHFSFSCNYCNMVCNNHKDFINHSKIHELNEYGSEDQISMDTESASSVRVVDNDTEVLSSPMKSEVAKANSVIAKVMSNEVFLMQSKRGMKKARKSCVVCKKAFSRYSDLKRHLIEHVIRSTLTKTPVNSQGKLAIPCDVCHKEIFSSIDKYKAHLREHAKLTIYKCVFCDKSFSDSSNFSKHKKIHGTKYFQCDLCQRKFNSKKTITLHMNRHNDNPPVKCTYCDKNFYFQSSLKKHVKSLHKKSKSRFRCRFCKKILKCLKDKWDHEWKTHNVRKKVVDCLICHLKFRKYTELRRHFNDTHNVDIGKAKHLTEEVQNTPSI